jgi:hypothetical protein
MLAAALHVCPVAHLLTFSCIQPATSASAAVAAVQEQLLLKTDYVVQQWQGRCQELRAQHEATLTDGISNQSVGAPGSQE